MIEKRSTLLKFLEGVFWYGFVPYLIVFHYIGLSLIPPIVALVLLITRKLPLKTLMIALKKMVPLIALVCALVALMFSSTLYSINPMVSLKTALKFTGLIALFFVLCAYAQNALSESDKDHFGLVLKRVFIITLGLFLSYRFYVDIFTHFIAPNQNITLETLKKPGFFYDNKTTGTVLVLLFWPFAYYTLKKGFVETLVLYCLLGVALFKTDGLTAQVAYLGAPIIALLIYAGALSLRAFITLCASFLVLFMPWISLYILTPQNLASHFDVYATRWHSLYHRLYIWHFAARKALEKKFFGWGVGASQYIPDASKEVEPGLVNLCSHPHNNYSQIWLELGASGAITVALLFFVFGKHLSAKGGRLYQSTTFAAFSATLVIIGMSYSAWHMWWLSALCMIALSFTALQMREST
ncbi:MAG: O-antigen ligase family protein [Alphaproteobacteria bacterium]|nr:O-antigen ligase family protein [Alphaproteobacteria bacterium]